ncbi:MAG: protocatechuate 3,4-dioxygenase [Myxococcaceae bacterium]
MKKRFYISGLVLLAASFAYSAEIHDSLWDAEHSSAEVGFAATPAQASGPFYPVKPPKETSSDLTVVHGKKALGVEVYLLGRILDTHGMPLAHAEVEIWQACQAGSYNHPRDTNPAPRDPNFEYYARTVTDASGNYLFKTIIPGPYPADDTWMRPSHIHFKVSSSAASRPFITQLYFDGNSFPNQVLSVVRGKQITGLVLNKLNELDLMLREVSEPGHSKLIVPFSKTEGFDAPVGLFNIYLNTQTNSEL